MSAGRRLARRVLLIGWDAADWQIIHPLMDGGLMPVLQRFVADGVMGNLASLEPMLLARCLWTSIATGKRMHKHGVSWFIEPHPDGRQHRHRAQHHAPLQGVLEHPQPGRPQELNVVGWSPPNRPSRSMACASPTFTRAARWSRCAPRSPGRT